MNMNEKRAEKLGEYLASDTERAKKLLTLSPEEALEAINGDGYDFTLDEINEYGAEVRRVSSLSSEISEENLEKVAGGVVEVITVAFVGTVAFAVGQRIGKYAPW